MDTNVKKAFLEKYREYYKNQGLPEAEIVKILGFKNAVALRKAVYLCMEKPEAAIERREIATKALELNGKDGMKDAELAESLGLKKHRLYFMVEVTSKEEETIAAIKKALDM